MTMQIRINFCELCGSTSDIHWQTGDSILMLCVPCAEDVKAFDKI